MVRLELIVDKKRGKEIPRVLMVSAWIEFCMGMMTGEVEKGGCRELRANTELYATALQSNRDLYERNKTDTPSALDVRLPTALQVLLREGWEDGTPPPHRDFKDGLLVS